MMIPRHLTQIVSERLAQFPAVVLLGPRQAGKTTLADMVAEGRPSRTRQVNDSLLRVDV
jgi:hypothetical protein